MVRLFFSLVILLFILSGCKNEIRYLKIFDQQCENLTNPFGIATNTPRLSWKIKSEENGTLQLAYQILAADDSMLLNDHDANLWNSGKVVSDKNVLVTWNGKNLTSRSIVYWKIRVWDEKGNASDWSRISNFSAKNQWWSRGSN